jgi:DNA-binding NarL/FixJ family response regulator
MPSSLINLAIVDDHTLLRKVLKNYLSEQKNMSVVLNSPDIKDLLNRLKDHYIQVLIMDVYMPTLGGYEAVKIIRSRYPEIKILILSMCTDMDLLSDILDLGIYGIVSKADDPDELIQAITSLSEHRIYRNKLFTDLMYLNKQHINKTNNSGPVVLLSEREREVLKLLWQEKSNKEIAEHLFLSIRSIEKIRQDMKDKLGIKSTIGLLKYAINKRIIGVNHYYNAEYGDESLVGRKL